MSKLKNTVLNPAIPFASLSLTRHLVFKLIEKNLITLDDARGIIIQCADAADEVTRNLSDDKPQAAFYEDLKSVFNETLDFLNLYHAPNTPM